jgi:hypothetical protein
MTERKIVKNILVILIVLLFLTTSVKSVVGSLDDNKESGILRDGDFDRSRDVYVNGVRRFIIYWQSSIFHPEDESQIISYIEDAARESWITLIDEFGFHAPSDPDGVIEILVFNTPPQYSRDADGQQYIFVYHNLDDDLIDFRARYHDFYPTEHDTYFLTISHEFFHAIQEYYMQAYNHPVSTTWIVEGTARFMQTVVAPDAEFWQNSYLVGLPGGPYSQSNDHHSSYIYEASWRYLSCPYVSLTNADYAAALYWRYLYEHHGGIETIRKIFERIRADSPGDDVARQIASINSVLGTTDLFFPDFAIANYLEFSPYPFARDNEFYQYSDRYYENVPSEGMTFDGSEIIDDGSVNPWASNYITINPTTSGPLRIHFDGDDSSDFFVKVFLIESGNIYGTKTLELGSAENGDYWISQANYYDDIALAVIRLGDDGTGSYTIDLTSGQGYQVDSFKFSDVIDSGSQHFVLPYHTQLRITASQGGQLGGGQGSGESIPANSSKGIPSELANYVVGAGRDGAIGFIDDTKSEGSENVFVDKSSWVEAGRGRDYVDYVNGRGEHRAQIYPGPIHTWDGERWVSYVFEDNTLLTSKTQNNTRQDRR